MMRARALRQRMADWRILACSSAGHREWAGKDNSRGSNNFVA